MAKPGKSTVVPRLRFPEFRGVQGWTNEPLMNVCRVLQGYGFPEELQGKSAGKYPFCKVSDISRAVADYGGLLTEAANYVGDDELLRLRAKPVPVGATVFAKIGEALRLNRRAYVQRECLIDNNAAALKAVEGAADDYFVYLLSQQIDLNKYCGGAVPSVSKTTLETVEVLVPDRAEQQKIANCLSSLNEVIAAQGRKVEALKRYKRGLMQQLFPREGETVPRVRFPQFRDASEWKTGKASDIVDVLQGYGFPDRLQGSKEGEFPFYKVSDISTYVAAGKVFLGSANNHINRNVVAELRAKLIPPGTTVFAKIGEAIRSSKRAITTRHCLVDNNAAGVKAIHGVADDVFVYYLWCQVPLIEYAGGVVPAVKKSVIEQIPVCYPGPEEQQRVSELLSLLDARLASESEKLEILKAHKQGLMQQLFPAPEEA